MRDVSWEREKPMKNEEFRQAIPSDDRTPLPKGETKPCMRGVLDLELYNRTGEVVMIEPLTEYVAPVGSMEVVEAFNPSVRRKGMKMLNPNKPKSEVLEKDLRSGLPIANIAKKYDASVQTIHNWIKSYGLAGIQGVKKPENDPVIHHTPPVNNTPPSQDTPLVQNTPIPSDMVQQSPSEIVQPHPDDDPVQEPPKVQMDPVNAVKIWNQDEWESSIKEKWEGDSTTAESKSNENPIPESDSPDPVSAPPRPFAEVWQNAAEDLAALKRSYITLAQQEFKDGLLEMVAYLMG